MTYQLAGVLDTRNAGSKKGIPHKCEAPGCTKTTRIWVCLDEIDYKPAGPTSFRTRRITGRHLIVGTCCCKKLVEEGKFPIYEESKVLTALEEPPIGITSREGMKLFKEFQTPKP